ncbi:MAG: LCP family protein [bacterium]|nr:LCP family protein [bacterium]
MTFELLKQLLAKYKLGLGLATVVFVAGFGVSYWWKLKASVKTEPISPIVSPVVSEKPPPPKPVFSDLSKKGSPQPTKTQPKEETPAPEPQTPISGEKPFNILLLGSDRRTAAEGWGRTDVIMVASLMMQKKRLVLTSIPRDLWVGGDRVNAAYGGRGSAGFKDLIRDITGLTIDRYFLTDFDGVAWAVQVLGGLDVNIARSFTDSEYPGHRQGQEGNITVNFEAGTQHLDGEQVVIYCRSRHGNNNEGSDFARSARQQNVIFSLPTNLQRALGQNGVDKVTELFSQASGKLVSDLTASDLLVLYSLAQDFGGYSFEGLNIADYLYNPPMADYGGAWVLVPSSGNYQAIHGYIQSKL